MLLGVSGDQAPVRLVLVLTAYYTTHCVKVNMSARNSTHNGSGECVRSCCHRCRVHEPTHRPHRPVVVVGPADQDPRRRRSACRAGHVKINGKAAKPSSSVAAGDTVEARLAQRQRDRRGDSGHRQTRRRRGCRRVLRRPLAPRRPNDHPRSHSPNGTAAPDDRPSGIGAGSTASAVADDSPGSVARRAPHWGGTSGRRCRP